jgi:deoxyribose-phosphate aldolase
VGGFPKGSSNCEEIVKEIRSAIELGADEIDIVLEPREEDDYPNELELEKLVAMREASEGKILKVIIETPLLTERKIRAVTRMSLAVGVDFVKTCTGKRGECKESDVDILSYELMRHELTFKECLGMKISGGIGDKMKLMRFIELIRKNDSEIINEKRLRVGSSSLIENLITIE